MRKMVELLTAWFWICPTCGKRNFETGTDPELGPDEAVAARRKLGIEPWDDGDLTLMPVIVRCHHCGEDFDVEYDATGMG
jgi:hypothetical protein